MTNNELIQFLKSECKKALSSAQNNELNESEMKHYLELPLNKLNEKIKSIDITDENHKILEKETVEIMSEFATELVQSDIQNKFNSL